MAKRRDRVTRKVVRGAKAVSSFRDGLEKNARVSPTQALREYDISGGLRYSKGADRKLGRRGVRARARLARMTQPPESDNGNSPP